MKEAVFLYGRNGTVQEFANKDVAYRELGFSFIAYTVAVHIGDVIADKYNFSAFNLHPKNAELARMNPYTTQKKIGDFVLRNEYGEILTIADFYEQDERLKNKDNYHINYRLRDWNGVGPVPGTGYKKRYGRWLRSPRTTSAIRSSLSVVKEDGEPEFRGNRRRGWSTLPTRWDDVYKDSYRDRSWKSFRKTQWKEKH